jgi:membrane-bound lytic murein transglycosylase MltF
MGRPRAGAKSGAVGLAAPLIAAVVIALSADAGFAQEPLFESGDDEGALALEIDSWTGDLDAILKRGQLRVGTAYNPIFLIYDGAEQSGMAVDGAAELEKFLKERLGEKAEELTVVVAPFARDDLIPALIDGRADLISANLTITAERAELVDFSNPTRTDVREIVVTGPGLADIGSFDDLVEPGLHLRPSSSYAESLAELNAARIAAEKEPIPLRKADERLEDHDLLEMVAAGSLRAVVVDDHKAELWAEIFDGLVLHDDLVLREGGEIGFAVRKESPALLEAVNAYVEISEKGTLLGNILIERYYGDEQRIVDALEPERASRLAEVIDVMREKAETYAFEPLLIAAQAFQESRFDHDSVSASGAVGIMQIRPETAADPNVGVEDIDSIEGNVEAGVKYLRFIHDRYFAEASETTDDAVFLSLAAYNAGPKKIADAQSEAEHMGLDPGRWFDHVEVAAARVAGQEPVHYVRNILKYYSQYKAYQALGEAEQGQAN